MYFSNKFKSHAPSILLVFFISVLYLLIQSSLQKNMSLDANWKLNKSSIIYKKKSLKIKLKIKKKLFMRFIVIYKKINSDLNYSKKNPHFLILYLIKRNDNNILHTIMLKLWLKFEKIKSTSLQLGNRTNELKLNHAWFYVRIWLTKCKT
jgi:hypothetical protein